MASSNRHWPSMFKTKRHPQGNHEINISNNCHRTQCSSERTPEPKPRWNPRPEQIRILEAIFNSGTMNPTRDEITKIRIQLQEYGQVGDANVFYWFQNRKSRSKNKQRQQQHNVAAVNCPAPAPQTTPRPPPAAVPHCDIPSSNMRAKTPDPQPTPRTTKPTVPSDFLSQPTFLFQPKSTYGSGYCSPDRSCPGLPISEVMVMSQCHCHPFPHSPALPPPPNAQTLVPGGGDVGSTTSTVFINDVCFEIGSGPFNVMEAFGDDAVLIHSTGHPVLTDEWGVTLQPLQHGGSYYLLRPFAPPSPATGLSVWYEFSCQSREAYLFLIVSNVCNRSRVRCRHPVCNRPPSSNSVCVSNFCVLGPV